ncbi:low temperature requirement protein A [Micromonospora sp. DT47]|uniref:low temperature requirement protein A n=1 Tax=Micromonospora sp. DT47 TaxID=3393431 RepID=UPI003CF36E09
MPPAPAARDRRATPFEIFFDLVFVFALTRIMALIGQPPTLVAMAQGLLLLVLLCPPCGDRGPARPDRLRCLAARPMCC